MCLPSGDVPHPQPPKSGQSFCAKHHKCASPCGSRMEYEISEAWNTPSSLGLSSPAAEAPPESAIPRLTDFTPKNNCQIRGFTFIFLYTRQYIFGIETACAASRAGWSQGLVWFGSVGFSFNASLEPQPRARRLMLFLGALCPSKSGLMNKHIVKHIASR